ncbi:hypothetical protein DRJ48_04350 [Candidatus Woesearchaeota archaeon]|nr:MAG: hypothetical protein DRJ48_04350 [Candidatus Woesearchaeota archaeon]
MKRVTELIAKGFTISVELVPPRNGIPLNSVLEQFKEIKQGVDFVSVTMGASGSLRGGTFPLSYFIQARFGIPVVTHFVCREHTRYQIENMLMDLHHFGIRNILALRGDPPAGQKDSGWSGDYPRAYMLVEQIQRMNQGIYLPRIGFEEKPREGLKTEFCILVAGHPEYPLDKEISNMRLKQDSGAMAAITQMAFSPADYRAYIKAIRAANISIPIIAGVRPLKSLNQGLSCESFFKIKLPQKLKEGFKKARDEYKFGLDYTAKLIKEIKSCGYAGVHLFCLNDFKLVKDLIVRINI